MPAPPASASSANTRRTSVTSTPSAEAMPPQTPASARSEELAAKAGRGMAGSWYGAVDADRPRPHTRVEDERSVARLDRVALDLPAVGVLAEDLDAACLGARVDSQRGVCGDGHVEVADVDARRHVRLAGRQGERREVETHGADPELVRAVEITRRDGCVVAVADAVTDVDVEHRRGDGGRDEDERDERPDRDRDALEEPADAVGIAPGERRRLGGLVLRAGLRKTVPGHPEDHASRDRQDDPDVPVRPERNVRDRDRARDREEPEPDQRPRTVAPLAQRARRHRVGLALARHHERRGGVDQDPGSAEQRQHDEADAEERRMDVEVPSEPARDAGEHPVGARAVEALGLGDAARVIGHDPRMTAGDPESPSGMTLTCPGGFGYATAASARSASVVSARRFQPVCGLPGKPAAGSATSSARGMFAIPAATSRMSSPRRAAATETSGNENAARSPRRSYAEASGGPGRLTETSSSPGPRSSRERSSSVGRRYRSRTGISRTPAAERISPVAPQ